jgi:hypothetical protein
MATLIQCFAHVSLFIRRIPGLVICNGTRGVAVGSGTALEVGKVAVSKLDVGVTGIFHLHNPSCRTMALGSIYPLTEMSTRNNSWEDKGSRFVFLTTLPP